MRKQELDHILKSLVDYHPEISDIIFTVGRPPQVILWGELKPVIIKSCPIQTLTPFHTEKIALTLISNTHKRLFENYFSQGYCDFSYSLEKIRFRVNVFSQRGYFSIAMRKLPDRIPTAEELYLPKIIYEIAEEKFGLILVTGPTGSGKSTTLAVILELINESRPCHIITLEDPIEFIHNHKKATFEQRELGVDFFSFAEGLRAALRQAPHVIFVGEIRDRESLEIALMAAETGHLVLSTLHTTDAGQTIHRILSMVPIQEESFTRLRVADSLKWVVSQRLLPRVDEGRILATEVMRKNLRVRELILNGETPDRTFYDVIETSGAFGMHTFDQSIVKLYNEGFITEETALAYASRKTVVRKEIDRIKAQKGEKTTDIEGLRIDFEYEKKIKKGT
ncbi:MAG: PilT/PilU family type 4a pilus ATPase [Thermodesulfovibrio sp.]|nr:PilT/PilU family type 4a pilus ATPase [Thermodesulfovibrio sp.]